MKSILKPIELGLLTTMLMACGDNQPAKEVAPLPDATAELTLEQIIENAKTEGEVHSLGMPDPWANWKGVWKDITETYNLTHTDTDMSSSQEIAKFLAEKNNATADIGDVGISYGPIALEKGVTQPYKTSYWDQVPTWAKDKDGHWMVAYTGTISFIINKDVVKNPPKTWQDMLTGDYKVHIGDVSVASQSVSAVLAANIALGGDESDLTPALDFFAELAKQGRLGYNDILIPNLEKGEVEVGVVWDFNGLGYRNQIDKNRFDVVIPQDGSVISGYTTIINRYAKHPNAAKLTREYIFSDKGQLQLARGFARPIRAEHINIPADVQENLLPDEQYANVKPIKDYDVWEKTAKELPALWQQKVLIHNK